MAKKDKVNAAFQTIMQGDEKQRRENKTDNERPVGVRLAVTEIERLDAAAKDLGVSRHEVMQYALRDFLIKFERGERPTVQEKTVYTLKPV